VRRALLGNDRVPPGREHPVAGEGTRQKRRTFDISFSGKSVLRHQVVHVVADTPPPILTLVPDPFELLHKDVLPVWVKSCKPSSPPARIAAPGR